MKRIGELDVAKGLGIILVLIGHLSLYGGLISRSIFNFHMPLFFVLAGVVFEPVKYKRMREVVWANVKSILFPYCIYCLIGLISYWIHGWLVPFSGDGLGFTLRSLYRGRPYFASPLWFLTCLFLVRVLFWQTYIFTSFNLGKCFMGGGGGY